MYQEVKRIHLIGVCGVAMGTLAAMLSERGYEVSGSDDNVYPPMSDMLAGWGIDVKRGYRTENLDNPDLVIIGNVISRGNAEVEHLLNNGIPYCSMADALARFFLRDREVICVAGTHGKSTTTALLGHILETAGCSPSFLVGGVSRNYDSNYMLGTGRYFVIEGDEYDSAFFEKFPKFILYRPRHIILTSLEFDHADIYRDLDEIALWFRRLMNIVPSEGTVLYSGEYPILKEMTSHSFSRTFSFGEHGDFSYTVSVSEDEYTGIELRSDGTRALPLRTRLFGRFNYCNVAAAASLAVLLGIDGSAIQRAVETFEGVKRRMELIFADDSLRIYEDYAHHPTSIGLVLEEVRKRFPDSTLWALYEPRSATSRRRVFQDALPQAFAPADRIIIKTPYRLDTVPDSEQIDIDAVIAALRDMQKDAELHRHVDDMVESVFRRMDSSRENVLVVMSNGGFDGIYGKLVERAERRK
jgi:UDP-N-acetylmuramate: L-alanyl-gamma-D-glutamyl-meso-diaminopimelate ligase